MKTPAKEQAPEKSADRQDTSSPPRRMSKLGAIETLMRRFEKTLQDKGVKLTVAEYIRLLQLRKELDVEEPKEIKVTWVEPTEKESVTKT
jgi:hypothetical protein